MEPRRLPPLEFGRNQRLTRAAEFSRIKLEGRTHRGALLMIGTLPSEEERLRAGFVTSKRIGNAVIRNRVRRRLREIVRLHQHQISRGFWIVTIARPAAAKASYAALEHEWLRLAERASILAP
jgi:ribonuclease P protein component